MQYNSEDRPPQVQSPTAAIGDAPTSAGPTSGGAFGTFGMGNIGDAGWRGSRKGWARVSMQGLYDLVVDWGIRKVLGEDKGETRWSTKRNGEEKNSDMRGACSYI